MPEDNNKNIKNLINRAIFFFGWLLSPFTFWNDTFINIPLSYLLANIFIILFPASFLVTTLIFYWLTNGLGLLMMYFSGKDIIRDREHAIRELLKLAVTIAVYSLILILFDRIGLLKPIMHYKV